MHEHKRKHTLYENLLSFFSGFIRWLFRVRVEGLENIPKGGCLLCCNHIDYPDAMILAASLPRSVRFLAKRELFHIPFISWFLKKSGAIPVRRNSADLSAIKGVIQAAQNGEAVAIYPQGHRCKGKDPRATEIRNGIGMMAYYASAPVVPVCIHLKKNRYAPFRRTHLLIGEPITYPFSEKRAGSKMYQEASAFFFSAVCALGENALPALPKGVQPCP